MSDTLRTAIASDEDAGDRIDRFLSLKFPELSRSRYKALVNDRKINAGFFSGITPYSHTQYWRDSDFLNPLVRHIKRLI